MHAKVPTNLVSVDRLRVVGALFVSVMVGLEVVADSGDPHQPS